MSGNLIFARDSATNTLYPVSCDSNGDIDVNIASLDPGHGLATEAKQDDIISDLTDGTQLARCMGLDTLGAQVQLKTEPDGSLHVITENADSVLIKGIETGTTTQRDCKQNANGDLRVQLIGNDGADGAGTMRIIKCDANGVLETSGSGGGGGDATAANQTLQLAQETVTATNSSSIDNKMSQGSDATLTNAQQVLVYGRDSGGVLDALKTDASGHLEVVVDDFVKGQATMANSFPVVIASDQSTIDVQTLRDADSTAISTTPVLANGTFTSTSVDMNGFSQLTIIGNTTNLTDQMDWYYSFDDVTFFKGTQVLYDFLTGDFAEQPNNGVGGARYIRVAQTDSTASNFTVQFASSKR